MGHCSSNDDARVMDESFELMVENEVFDERVLENNEAAEDDPEEKL